MSFPFSPLVTFADNSVPKATASFLNDLQAGINCAARPIYMTQVNALSESRDGTGIILAIGSTLIKDETTLKYTYVDGYSGTLNTSGLANNTWYYVYLVSTNGVSSVEYATTAPATPTIGFSPLWKNGDETRRYVCAFLSDGAGAVISFFCIHGRYTLLPANPIYLVSSAAGATSYSASIALTPGAPPHAWRVKLQVAFRSATGAATGNVRVRPGVAALEGHPVADIQNGGVDIKATEQIDVPRMGDGMIQWKTSIASGTVDIAILGFEE